MEQLRHLFRYPESVRLKQVSTPPLTVQSAYHSDAKSRRMDGKLDLYQICLGKYDAKKILTRGLSGAKMISAVSCLCKYYANVAFTTFGPDFLLVCYFLHCTCPQQIWCKSVFSCLGDSLAKTTNVHCFIKTPNRG